MAELIRQTAEVRQKFRRAIEQDERRRREESVDRLERKHPVLGTIIAPLANLVLFDEDLKKWNKGFDGESRVARTLRRLPSPWCYLNNIVLERKPDEYMQIDHIAVGPSGVAVIETKNWRGALQGTRDFWKVKSARGWSRVQKSPTRQAVWHARAVQRYLQALAVSVSVTPIVVFIDPDWLRHQECTCPVFGDVRSMRDHLLSQEGSPLLSPEQCKAVGESLAAAFSLYELPQHAPAEAAAAAPRKEPDLPLPPPASHPEGGAGGRATPRQRTYVAQLLGAAGLQPVPSRLDLLTRAEAQAVIDRLRFRRDVDLPDGLVESD